MNGVAAKKTFERQSGIELLRVFAIMGVILAHYNNPGIGGGFRFAAEGSINSTLMIVIESMCICVVNVFMMISGYFMCEKRSVALNKPIELLLQLICFELILYFLKVLAGQGQFTWGLLLAALVPSDYFVSLYVTTYILSPFINALTSRLGQKQLKLLLIVVFLLFSVQTGVLWLLEEFSGISFPAASTVSQRGDIGGYTIVNFIMCYLIGTGIRHGVFAVKKPLSCLGIFALCVAIISLERNWDFCNPAVMIAAAALFMLFKNLNIKNSRIINQLARASFTVYLLHWTFIVRAGIKGFAQGPAVLMLCHMLATAVIIYGLCFVVYLIWDAITTPMYRCLWRKIRIPVISLESE